jgi:plasmid maintenance system antidote protein VapI
VTARRAPGRGRPRSSATSAFSRWLDRRGQTRGWAAEKLGVTRTYIDKLCRSDASPSLALAAKVERLTGGAVSATMWSVQPRVSRK